MIVRMVRSNGWTGVELRHFLALDAVASEASFNRAAAKLGYTQSAISQQIAALERVVGQKLIERPGGAQPVRLRWDEEAPCVAIAPRSLGISLPRLPPGGYVLEVAVRTRGGATAFTQRELEVVR